MSKKNIIATKVFGNMQAFKVIVKNRVLLGFVICFSVIFTTASFVVLFDMMPQRKPQQFKKPLIKAEMPEQSEWVETLKSSNAKGLTKPQNESSIVQSEHKVSMSGEFNKTDTKRGIVDIDLKDNSQKKLDPQSSNQRDKAGDSIDPGSSVKKDGTTGSQAFSMPVQGVITYDFSCDRLAYSKTLDEWRTHSGIDLTASRGTAVKAVLDGVVTEVLDDPQLGVTVVVSHNDGFETVYSNLANDGMVFPNQKVQQDTCIGMVGNTAAIEVLTEPHLHFEIRKNKEPVDPKKYLPYVRIG